MSKKMYGRWYTVRNDYGTTGVNECRETEGTLRAHWLGVIMAPLELNECREMSLCIEGNR